MKLNIDEPTNVDVRERMRDELTRVFKLTNEHVDQLFAAFPESIDDFEYDYNHVPGHESTIMFAQTLMRWEQGMPN